jgi:exodeoxyribonuclease-3
VSVPAGAVRIVSLYLPNGNPTGTEKFDYKLAWMARLETYARGRLALEEAFVLAGDFNVIPDPIDARFPDHWTRDALFQPETRAAYRRLLNLGLTDAFRACEPGDGHYTFWDYQAAPGRRTTASGSIICCCRRRRPTASTALKSISARGVGKSRRTTCR